MSRTDKILKSLIYALGGLATVGFLITKNPSALGWITSRDYGYGDLYRFSKIEQFKPSAPLTRGKSGNMDSIDQGKQKPDEQDTILFGDSFSFCDWGETPFQMQLQKKIGAPWFSVFNGHHDMFWKNPYLLLEPQTNHPVLPRVLVYEIVERSISWQFANPLSTNEIQSGTAADSWSKIQGIMFDNSEARNELLLKHSLLTSPLIGFWNTAMFELFRRPPSETPLYSLKPPFLFFQEEAACFQAQHDEPLVAKLADNIALFNRELQERFGCALIFVPIPNKITVYSRFATDQSYDDFLPRLCSALKMRGVNTVELLPVFQKQTNLLYWPTDTHWNNLGIRLAVEQTLKQWPPSRPQP